MAPHQAHAESNRESFSCRAIGRLLATIFSDLLSSTSTSLGLFSSVSKLQQSLLPSFRQFTLQRGIECATHIRQTPFHSFIRRLSLSIQLVRRSPLIALANLHSTLHLFGLFDIGLLHNGRGEGSSLRGERKTGGCSYLANSQSSKREASCEAAGHPCVCICNVSAIDILTCGVHAKLYPQRLDFSELKCYSV